MPDESNTLCQKNLESLTSPAVRIADEQGLTLSRLINKLGELMDAKIKKQFCYEGKVVEGAEPQPDNPSQQRAVELLLRVRGELVEKKHISLEGSIQSIPLDEEAQAKLEAAKELIKERSKKVE